MQSKFMETSSLLDNLTWSVPHTPDRQKASGLGASDLRIRCRFGVELLDQRRMLRAAALKGADSQPKKKKIAEISDSLPDGTRMPYRIAHGIII